MTDESSVNLIFLKKITDPNDMDSLFIGAYTAKLAAELAEPVTGSRSLAEQMWQLYERKVREARTIDSQEGTVSNLDIQQLVDARSGTVI